ncbi:MAG: O-antigen ligase family protein [Candidatus Atribacteria bacterium]|nr:O-antigen ligase family protein [Candidatus Atribacteria bacterium]
MPDKSIKRGKKAEKNHSLSPAKPVPWMEQAFQGVLLGLVLLSPYYRGLYFDYERFPFFSIVYVVAAFFFLYRSVVLRKKTSLQTLPEWAFFFFAIFYGVNVFFAADRGLALREFFNIFTFFIFFLVASDAFQTPESKKKALFLFALNGIILIFLGYFYQFGWINPAGRPLGMNMHDLYLREINRLQSTLQYPNTTAAYIAMGYCASLLFFFLEEQKLKRILSVGMMFLLITGFFFTNSRGALLMLVVTIILLLFLLPRRQKIIFFFLLLFSFLIFLPLSPFLEFSLVHAQAGKFIGLLLIGSLLLVGCQFGFALVEKKVLSISNRSYFLTGAIVGAGIMILLLLSWYSGLFTSPLSNRLRNITLGTIISQERWIFYRDAIHLFLQRPVSGWGGGGWMARYLAIQSYPYFSESTHNYYLQVLVESGILGLFLLGVFLGSLFITGIRQIKRLTSDELIILVGTLGILFMGFSHSFVDVNFSLGAYQFAIWFFCAWVDQALKRNPKSSFSWKMQFRSEISVVVCLGFLILSLFLNGGVRAAIWGEYFASRGEIQTAEMYYQTAIQREPWNAGNYHALSQIYRTIFITQKDQATRELSIKNAVRALDLAPFNALYLENMAVLSVERGNFDTGVRLFEESILEAPFIITRYEHFCATCRSIAEFYLSQGDAERARFYFQKALAVGDLFQGFAARSIVPIPTSQNLTNMILEITTRLQAFQP